MKFRILHQWLLITGTAGLLASSSTTFAQSNFPGQSTRMPDGSIRYPDGSVRYPDGTVRYPNGSTANRYPDNRGRNDRDRDDHRDRDWDRDRDRDNDRWERNNNDRPIVIIDGNGRMISEPRHLPPGQAKKIYGYRSAKGFSHGQRKKYQKKYGYVPAVVMAVPDRYCKRGNGGRYYYTNPLGFTYWRDRDGFYVLDNRYF